MHLALPRTCRWPCRKLGTPLPAPAPASRPPLSAVSPDPLPTAGHPHGPTAVTHVTCWLRPPRIQPMTGQEAARCPTDAAIRWPPAADSVPASLTSWTGREGTSVSPRTHSEAVLRPLRLQGGRGRGGHRGAERASELPRVTRVVSGERGSVWRKPGGDALHFTDEETGLGGGRSWPVFSEMG